LAGLFGVSSVLLTVQFGTLASGSLVARFDNLSGASANGTVLSVPFGLLVLAGAGLSIYNDNNACYLSVTAIAIGTQSNIAFSSTPFAVIQNPLPISGSGTASLTAGIPPNQNITQDSGTFTLE
jgi:hypothetical protein